MAFEQFKPVIDIASIGTIVATLFSYLPSATALLVFAWMIFRLANEISIWRERKTIALYRELRTYPPSRTKEETPPDDLPR